MPALRHPRVMVDRRLLRICFEQGPGQPATAFWRAIEVGQLIANGLLPRTGRGLDLGCGDGRVTALVQQELGASWSLTGVDPDEQELALARGCMLYEELQRTEGAAVTAPDRSFDFVLSNSVLEHVEELGPLLDEVGRVLRVGGLFVFTVPSDHFHENVGSPGILARLATGESDPVGYHRALDRRLAHLRYLGVEEWRRLLDAAGLGLIQAESFVSARETRRWAALSNATAGLLMRILGGRPIELQRRLRIRRGRPPLWVRVVGPALGRIALLGLRTDNRGYGHGSCLLIVAERL